MSIPDTDVLGIAKVLVERHGGDAPLHASRRADEFKVAGDLEGSAIWTRIAAQAHLALRKTAP